MVDGIDDAEGESYYPRRGEEFVSDLDDAMDREGKVFIGMNWHVCYLRQDECIECREGFQVERDGSAD